MYKIKTNKQNYIKLKIKSKYYLKIIRENYLINKIKIRSYRNGEKYSKIKFLYMKINKNIPFLSFIQKNNYLSGICLYKINLIKIKKYNQDDLKKIIKKLILKIIS